MDMTLLFRLMMKRCLVGRSRYSSYQGSMMVTSSWTLGPSSRSPSTSAITFWGSVRISTSKMWSLGTFEQDLSGSELICSIMFSSWLKERIPEVRIVHWRPPNHEWSMYSDAHHLEWHNDGIADYLIVWSNTVGTEILDPAMNIYQGAPGEVILLNNKFFKHRPPKGVSKAEARNRYFARANVRGADSIRNISGVHALELLS